ncbi:hypothetical protein [Alkalihalobacterium alkalinitrilicum]|uniref:hypothetical protein n=1 Tax=Alkalihalobacterium alkalinitrilicum TaxID=427920 RepID=UPI000995D004|nr:hypothetical protein [Alkalihalobacterium alkalinitrilicum]
MNLGEKVLSNLVAALKDLYPNIEVKSTKNKLSTVLSEYYIQRIELGEVHPDLEEKIQFVHLGKKTRRFKFYYSRQLPHGIKFVC